MHKYCLALTEAGESDRKLENYCPLIVICDSVSHWVSMNPFLVFSMDSLLPIIDTSGLT